MGVVTTQSKKQLLSLQQVTQFEGAISCASDRKRIELTKNFRDLFPNLNNSSSYVIEVSLNKEMLLERLQQLIMEEKIIPSLLYFCKK